MASPYITCKEVQEITGMSQTKSYDTIRKLNRELEAQGYLTFRGRVPRKYFYERTGVKEEAHEI